MITFNITDERWQEVADELNWTYDTLITIKILKRFITESSLLIEVAKNTYSDTAPREELIEVISDKMVGLSWPIFGLPEKYKEAFNIKAREAGLLK